MSDRTDRLERRLTGELRKALSRAGWWRLALAFWVMGTGDPSLAGTRRVHVVVALADNATQGIAPVPAKIGNGDDAAQNLYWGASEGFRSVFGASRDWKLDRTDANPSTEVLERRTYHHITSDCVLVAEAWRGRDIHGALGAYFAHLRDGPDDLVAFIGHNGLMDRALAPIPAARPTRTADAIVLCCRSGEWFAPHLAALKARPVLTTEQLMYPGSFLLRDALAVWLRKGSRPEIRTAAARSYAKNQGISLKAAMGVFSALD